MGYKGEHEEAVQMTSGFLSHTNVYIEAPLM